MFKKCIPVRLLPLFLGFAMFFSLPLRSSCLSVPFPIGDDVKECLFQSFKTAMKDRFDVDTFDTTVPNTVTAEPIEFRIRHSRPLIGTPPKLPNPKFKKQRLIYTASVTDNGTLCVSCESRVYNRRDKRWYPVKSDGRLEQQALQPVMSQLLKGRVCWVLGTLPGSMNNAPAVLNGGVRVQIESALIIQQDVKRLQLDLSTPDEQIFTYPIAFIGDTSSVLTVLEHILSRFAWNDPLAQVPEKYAFFNAYARHGELMDGMVPAQVMVALGKPSRIAQAGSDQTLWYYSASTGYESLLFEDGELVLSH